MRRGSAPPRTTPPTVREGSDFVRRRGVSFQAAPTGVSSAPAETLAYRREAAAGRNAARREAHLRLASVSDRAAPTCASWQARLLVYRLFLLRHAKSSWKDPGQADHDRPLAGRGRRAAKALARHRPGCSRLTGRSRSSSEGKEPRCDSQVPGRGVGVRRSPLPRGDRSVPRSRSASACLRSDMQGPRGALSPFAMRRPRQCP
jgi:hypothetical protein